MSFNPFAKIALNSLFMTTSEKNKKRDKKSKTHKESKTGNEKRCCLDLSLDEK